MSEIRTYLEEKAALPEREWLRRETRETHPTILAAVRQALHTIPPSRGGVIYDDDVERFVNELAGDLPEHRHHGADRDRLIVQLGHEVYIARSLIRDEENAALEAEALEAGYARLADVELADGGRYLIRLGTLYSGYDVPVYAAERAVRAVRDGERFVFMPKGARTRGFIASGPALVRAA
jgi:hypothetical protein